MDGVTLSGMILDSGVFDGSRGVCFLGEKYSEGERFCEDLRNAILSSEEEDGFSLGVTGAIFKRGEVSYVVSSSNIEHQLLLKRIIEHGSLNINSFERDDLKGFIITES